MKISLSSFSSVPPRPPPNGHPRPPRAHYWGDTSARKSQAMLSAPPASASEKLPLETVAPPAPTALPRRRFRLAFPVFLLVVVAPAVACTVLPALVMTGVMSALPAAIVGLSVFGMVVLGAAVVTWLENWESAPR